MPTDEAPAAGPHAEPLRPVTAEELDRAPFPYLRWAKAYLAWDAQCMGMSGLAPLSEAERVDLGLAAPPEVGDPAGALKRALAERYGLAPENVHPAAGTSHANFVAYLALARGQSVAVELPAYEALHRLADAVSATLCTFARDPRRAWRIDRDRLAEAVTPATSLVVVSDLHNPSGVRLHAEDLDLLIEAAEGVDAHVLVDEVYADFDSQERPTAALRDPRVVVTNSLTKAHGLPDLRAGWVLASSETIEEIAGWDELVHPALPPAPMAEAAAYVPHARARMAPVRALAAARTDQVDAWVGATPGISWVRPDGGLTGFLSIGDRDGDAVATRLQEEHGVVVVPGSFFQDSHALRISFLLEEEDLARALSALGSVLEEVQ